MAWVRLDDHFDEHPKFQNAGPMAAALWMAGLAYSNRNLTDGFIPWAKVPSLWSWTWLEDPDSDGRAKVVRAGITSGMGGEDEPGAIVVYLTKRLVACGLWDEVEGGYAIHDFRDFQPTKQQVLTMRAKDSRRKRQSAVPAESDKSPGGIPADSSDPVPVPIPKKKNLRMASSLTLGSEASNEANRRNARDLILGLVAAKSVSSLTGSADWRPQTWDDARAAAKTPEQARELMAFAGKIRNDGITDQFVIARMFQRIVNEKISNPYAYFAANGITAQTLVGERAVEKAEAQKAEISAEESRFFAENTDAEQA